MNISWKAVAVATGSAFALAACGGGTNSGGSGGSMSSMSPSAPAAPSASASGAAGATKAADLRTQLNVLLGEHIILASKATGAALGGRTDEYKAYGDLLNKNGTDIGAMIGAAFGTDAQNKFNQIWSAHDGFFVDYTTGLATKDQAKSDKAVSDLTNTYIPQFSALIAGATGLPQATVADLTKTHVLTTKDIVDAQAAGNPAASYAATRKAYAHMRMIGDPLSAAIAKKVADKFPGDPAAKAVDLRVGLDLLLQEHLYLASDATGAALGGRQPEFAAAGKALNDNGTDIGAAIGSIYGADAQNKFNQIWSAHNGFFVDYTTGVATKDKAKMDKAVADLTNTYIPQFSDFIASATGLPSSAVAGLTKDHVLTTKQIVDDQGAKDFAKAAADDRTAAQHMMMIGDPVAAGIVAKNASKF